MSEDIPKVAVISHVLPPAGSGQAVVLYRLLEGLPANRYCLISNRDCNAFQPLKGEATTMKLPGTHYSLRWTFSFEFLRKRGHNIISNNLGFLLNKITGPQRRAKQISEIVRREKCKVIVACTGDIFNMHAASLASESTGVPLILYIFDDPLYQWSDSKRALASKLLPGIMAKANSLIVTNEHLAEDMRKRYESECTIVRNLTSDWTKEKKEELPELSSNGIDIIYMGAIYEVHHDAFRNLVAAIETLSDERVKLHLYTSFPRDFLEKKGIGGHAIVYHQTVHQSKVFQIMAKVDVLFLPLSFEKAYSDIVRTSSPGKLGDYLATGIPVLVHAPRDAFVSWYFRKNNCGVVVDHNDIQELASSLKRIITEKELREEISSRAKLAADRDFRLDRVRNVFFTLLRSIERKHIRNQ